jgi:hypothetical protein
VDASRDSARSSVLGGGCPPLGRLRVRAHRQIYSTALKLIRSALVPKWCSTKLINWFGLHLPFRGRKRAQSPLRKSLLSKLKVQAQISSNSQRETEAQRSLPKLNLRLQTQTQAEAQRSLPKLNLRLNLKLKLNRNTAAHAMASSSSSAASLSQLPSEPEPWRANDRPPLPPGHLLDIDEGPMYDILTMYLRIEDVCHLDSALCNKGRRAEFLEMISRKVLLFNRDSIAREEGGRLVTKAHKALDSAALSWILKRGIHLASLRLKRSGNKPLGEHERVRAAVASLVNNGCLDKLEVISLLYCYYIKDADLTPILAKSCRSVKSINLMGCGLDGSSALHVKYCTELEAFAAGGQESVVDLVAIFKACRQLRRVNLGDIGVRLTDEVVQSVAANCPLLDHLITNDCPDVSDAAIKKVAESCPLLQYVDLWGSTSITDSSVVALSKSCPLLTELLLGNCDCLTDAAVFAVAQGLPGLTQICLAGIDAITSSALGILASKCRALRKVDLSHCFNVDDICLGKIAKHCSDLIVLNVEGCVVTGIGIATVASKCLKLQVFCISIEIFTSCFPTLMLVFPHLEWS